MSNVNATNKAGHPVLGIILGIAGIGIALLMTLLFGVIAGAVAGALGIGAALLGFFARKRGKRGMGAIVAGALAIVLAISMTFASANTMKAMKEAAESSGVAPTFAKYMDNPYLGIYAVAANTAKAENTDEAVKTIQKEMDALKAYMVEKENANTEKAAEKTADNTEETSTETKAEANTGISVGNSVGVTLSIGG